MDEFNLMNSIQKSILNIFKLDEDLPDDSPLKNCFKVLIFDDYVFELICPLLKVFTLREQNITFHININAEKERIPDVMAIYILTPTTENLKHIKSDLNNNIFDNYYFNFVENTSEDFMQELFSEISTSNKFNNIYKIEVNPMGFYIYHPRVFSLNIKSPYKLLSSPGLSDDHFNNYINSVSKGLFNTLFSLKTIPIIKYRSGSFMDSIVKEIQNQFDFTFDKFNELTEDFHKNKNNTLLILVERETDLPIMFNHSTSLGSFIHDLFGIIRGKNNNKEKDNNEIIPPLELDPLADFIWNKYISQDYISVVNEELTKIFNEHSKEYNTDQDSDILKVTEKMNNTLENIKDIQLKNNLIKTYSKYNKGIFDMISKKELGLFTYLESKLLSTREINKEIKNDTINMLNLSKFKETNNSNINYDLLKDDLLRLTLIYYIINDKISKEETTTIENLLKQNNIDISAFEYLKKKKSFKESMNMSNSNNNEKSGMLYSGFNMMYNKFTNIIKDEDKSSIISNLVNNLSSGVTHETFVEYNLVKKANVNSKNTNYNNVIVFICGGGSLNEYENLDNLISSKKKNVSIYYYVIYIYINLFFLL